MSFCIEQKLNWLYIDINSYFATIEQQIDHSIREKPVVVVPLLSDSTCAIAASYEAKRLGINTGTRIYQAKKICPELICIKARHDVYIEYHHRIFREIDLHLHVDHVFSIDEGACKLTGKYCNESDAISIGRIIKKAIRDNVGEYISCSIGIAPNRYLAKIASNLQKPDGLSVITPPEFPNRLYPLKLNSLPGVGAKTGDKLMRNGISTIEQLCKLDRTRLKALWGNVWGEKVWYLIRGADLPLEETKKATIGHSQVLAPESQLPEEARAVLVTLILKAASRLRSRRLYTTSVLLVIDLKSGKPIKERIKIELSDDSSLILKHALKTWDKIIQNQKLEKTRIKKLAISLHNLQEESNQLTFGDFNEQRKRQRISRVIDYINKKIGRDSVSIGIMPRVNETKQIVAFSHIPER